MKNKKIIVGIIISGIVIVLLIIMALIFTHKSSKKSSTDLNGEKLYSLSELTFLKEINTNSIFTILDTGVNSELIGTYAFKTTPNSDETINIVALKTDGTEINIYTTKYSDWKNGIDYLYYDNGNIYFKNADDFINKISINEGNGNYKIVSYDFLEGYITAQKWSFIKDNKIYYFNDGAIRIGNLITEDWEDAVIIDSEQSFLSFKIDGYEVNTDFDKVYIDKDNMNVFVFSNDNEHIFKINISDGTYTEVNAIDTNARLLSSKEKLKIDNIEFNYEYGDDMHFYLEVDGTKYELEKGSITRPVTLLANNYLLIIEVSEKSFLDSKVKFINLKTGVEDNDYFINYDSYGSEIYFVEK